MGDLFTQQYPIISSGIVDSCDGYLFPECPGWKVEAISGAFYYFDKFVNYTTDAQHPLQFESFIHTMIAGVHVPGGSQNLTDIKMKRSFECLVLNKTSEGFTIRMKTKRSVYQASLSGRCSWIQTGALKPVS